MLQTSMIWALAVLSAAIGGLSVGDAIVAAQAGESWVFAAIRAVIWTSGAVIWFLAGRIDCRTERLVGKLEELAKSGQVAGEAQNAASARPQGRGTCEESDD